MGHIVHSEFGKIIIRRSLRASYIKLRVSPNGQLVASMPVGAPTFLLKRMLSSSSDEIRNLIKSSRQSIVYSNGSVIGKSHTIVIASTDDNELFVERKGLKINVYLTPSDSLEMPHVIESIRPYVQKALRIEAKNYLPSRLKYLADMYGFKFDNIRFSHAGSRWGSCSSRGTISLNIALMKLPPELIDYVLVHELAHTKQMNHSKKFWNIVEAICPNYKILKNQLKNHSPTI